MECTEHYKHFSSDYLHPDVQCLGQIITPDAASGGFIVTETLQRLVSASDMAEVNQNATNEKESLQNFDPTPRLAVLDANIATYDQAVADFAVAQAALLQDTPVDPAPAQLEDQGMAQEALGA